MQTLELSKGSQTVRFADDEYQGLHFAVNQYLTTSDDRIWASYRGQLYRIEME